MRTVSPAQKIYAALSGNTSRPPTGDADRVSLTASEYSNSAAWRSARTHRTRGPSTALFCVVMRGNVYAQISKYGLANGLCG